MTVATGTKIRVPSPRGLVIRQSLPSISYYGGWLVGRRRGSRYCQVPTSTTPYADMIIEGVAEYIESPPFTASSTADAGGGAIDSITQQPQNIRIVTAPTGWFDQTGTTITEAHVGLSAYAVNNNTVSLSDSNGTLPRAGTIDRVNPDGKVSLVFDNKVDDIAGGDDFDFEATVRGVITSLAANSGTTTGTLTADATGAIGAQDGLTLVAGDEVLIQAGTTNLDAATDAGPYEVINPGGVGVAFVLRRPAWWPTGGVMPLGASIKVAEGTLYGRTVWDATAAKGAVIDTDAPAFYPREVIQQVTLVAGTATIANVPVRAAAKVSVHPTVAGGTPAATTTSYQVKLSGGITAGALGTASLIIEAQSVVGTIVNTDVSVLNVSVRNG